MKNLQPPAQTFQPPPQTKSTVLLLRNMVGPGEVDASLQEETAEECARFGKVERCLIYEVFNFNLYFHTLLLFQLFFLLKIK